MPRDPAEPAAALEEADGLATLPAEQLNGKAGLALRHGARRGCRAEAGTLGLSPGPGQGEEDGVRRGKVGGQIGKRVHIPVLVQCVLMQRACVAWGVG